MKSYLKFNGQPFHEEIKTNRIFRHLLPKVRTQTSRLTPCLFLFFYLKIMISLENCIDLKARHDDVMGRFVFK